MSVSIKWKLSVVFLVFKPSLLGEMLGLFGKAVPQRKDYLVTFLRIYLPGSTPVLPRA